jgi:hypothetical protein
MEAIPQRRAYHVFVRLAGNPIFYQDDIYRLRGALPSCTRPVIADNAVIVLATITEDSETELLERCKAALNHYHVLTVVELGRLSASTDGLFDPFHDWMHTNVRRGTGGEGYNSEDVLKAKWGKVRRENTEDGRVADAIRKVFSGPFWQRRKRA